MHFKSCDSLLMQSDETLCQKLIKEDDGNVKHCFFCILEGLLTGTSFTFTPNRERRLPWYLLSDHRQVEFFSPLLITILIELY